MEAQRVLDRVRAAGLDALVFAEADPRWARLVFHPASSLDLRDRFRGALVGGAIGDAMGRPNEGVPGQVARDRRIREYQPWRAWQGEPKGTVTDDTQMTMWLAESILAAARKVLGAGAIAARDRLLDPHDLAERSTREPIRGIGQATRDFVHEYKVLGKPWHTAGIPSAGNGTAMRAAAAPAGSLATLESRLGLCADLAVLLEGLELPGYELRGGSGAPSLHGRIGTELPRYIQENRPPFAEWHNGAYVLESLPCALWCFLATPDDFEQSLFTAVDAGHDADTVAAMACRVSGAYHGLSRLPSRLLDDLEFRDRLIELAGGLHDLCRQLYGAD